MNYYTVLSQSACRKFGECMFQITRRKSILLSKARINLDKMLLHISVREVALLQILDRLYYTLPRSVSLQIPDIRIQNSIVN